MQYRQPTVNQHSNLACTPKRDHASSQKSIKSDHYSSLSGMPEKMETGYFQWCRAWYYCGSIYLTDQGMHYTSMRMTGSVLEGSLYWSGRSPRELRCTQRRSSNADVPSFPLANSFLYFPSFFEVVLLPEG